MHVVTITAKRQATLPAALCVLLRAWGPLGRSTSASPRVPPEAVLLHPGEDHVERLPHDRPKV